MALFTKEPDKNVRTDPNARVQPQPPASSVTPTVVTTNPLPSEKPTMPMRPTLAAPASDARAYLGSGSKISGKLSFDGPTRIDGQVDGEITGKDSLTIGESAVVTAQIRAAAIIVAGKVSGDIIASNRIEIRPSAKVIGNLTAPVLVVHEGALFEGHCSMQPEAAQSAKVTVFAKDERVAPVGVQKQA
jgi:cytoskeletal protein CcmA (bactofilin family)